MSEWVNEWNLGTRFICLCMCETNGPLPWTVPQISFLGLALFCLPPWSPVARGLLSSQLHAARLRTASNYLLLPCLCSCCFSPASPNAFSPSTNGLRIPQSQLFPEPFLTHSQSAFFILWISTGLGASQVVLRASENRCLALWRLCWWDCNPRVCSLRPAERSQCQGVSCQLNLMLTQELLSILNIFLPTQVRPL